MSPFLERILLLLSVLCCLQATTALMCYDCNSEYDPRCGDPFEPYSIGEVNCSKQEPLEHLKDKYKPTLCRKTLQKVYGKVRVVRGCGYIPDERADDGQCMKRSGTHDVQAFYCSCTTDLCNQGSSFMPLNNVYIATLGTMLLATYLLNNNFHSLNFKQLTTTSKST